jgi:hypothetical protein
MRGRTEEITEETAMENSVSCARLDVRTLLRALADGWQSYLPAMACLSAGDTTAYLAAQGYDRVRDLLACATAWGEEALGVVPLLLRDEAIQRYDAQAFNAQAVARFRMFACADVEWRFTQAYAALAQMLALLPDAALARPDVYEWLYTTIVDQFNERRPPNMARVP